MVYKDAAGIWYEDRFRPLFTALLNLILNIIMVRYLQKAKSICYINDPLYFYRCNNINSLTHQYRDNEFTRQKKQIEKIELELGKFIDPKRFLYRTDRYFLGRCSGWI